MRLPGRLPQSRGSSPRGGAAGGSPRRAERPQRSRTASGRPRPEAQVATPCYGPCAYRRHKQPQEKPAPPPPTPPPPKMFSPLSIPSSSALPHGPSPHSIRLALPFATPSSAMNDSTPRDDRLRRRPKNDHERPSFRKTAARSFGPMASGAAVAPLHDRACQSPTPADPPGRSERPRDSRFGQRGFS